jgi:hypothetical protein
VRRALPLAAMLAACSLREPRVSTSSCTNNGQCSSANVCFLGECRPPAANLSVVRVEVRPPNGSQFAVRKAQVDLRASVRNDFSLALPFSGTGTLTQDGTGIDGGTVVFIDHLPVIPDRVEQVVATTDVAGVYRPRLPQGVWDVLVLPPAHLPPLRAGPLDTTLTPSLDFALPAAASLTAYDGALTVNGDGGPVAGASVTAIDSQGAPLSATSTSNPDGGYSLLLPPGSPQFSLQISPTADGDGGTADPALDPFPTYPPLPYATVIDLPLAPRATLSVRVVDAAGDLVPSARVYVRSVGTPWTLARSVVADTGESDVVLREGDYLVQAAPPTDATSPGLSASSPVTLPLAAPFEITCPAKVRRLGQILGPDGRAVGANFQIVATRVADGLIPTRTASTTPTDANGVFRFVGDEGSWRFEIMPPAEVRLPRTVVGVTLSATDPQDSSMDSIRLSQPLRVGGIVTGRVSPGGADTLVGNAMVSFFSLDSNSHSVLLGSARTDLTGYYDVVLPDVAQPGVGP